MSIKPIDMHLSYANAIKEAKVKQDDFNRPRIQVDQIQNQQENIIKKNLSKVRSAEGSEHARISKEKINKEQQNAKKRKKQNKDKSHNSKEENSLKTSKLVDETKKIGTVLDISI
ncbi:MAG: hypothetical protein COA82_05200 [Alkaliphilus sp.]|nr:hypothetical protein [Alkaliphilus transvaalensis]PHS35272.1 MAG: hypothetical protein COA82_05200 [Alkaliphilus sp.]